MGVGGQIPTPPPIRVRSLGWGLAKFFGIGEGDGDITPSGEEMFSRGETLLVDDPEGGLLCLNCLGDRDNPRQSGVWNVLIIGLGRLPFERVLVRGRCCLNKSLPDSSLPLERGNSYVLSVIGTFFVIIVLM